MFLLKQAISELRYIRLKGGKLIRQECPTFVRKSFFCARWHWDHKFLFEINSELTSEENPNKQGAGEFLSF